MIHLKKLFLPLALLLSLVSAVSFTNVSVSPSATTAYIFWITDENCSAQVKYGETTSYGKAISNSTKALLHSAKLSGLKPSTLYHYSLICKVNGSAIFNSSDYTFATIQALPDLFVSPGGITYSFKEANGKPMLYITAIISNNGTGKASSVKVLVQSGSFSANKTISSVSEGSQSMISLSLPAAGVSSIIVTADPSNAIAEFNESNNRAERMVSTEAFLPDLNVSDSGITHAPFNPKSGDSVIITAKIYNHGYSTARNVKVRFVKAEKVITYEEKDGEVREREMRDSARMLAGIRKENTPPFVHGETLGEVVINSIPPQSSKQARLTLKMPQGVNSFLVAVQADPENSIEEASEANNLAFHSIAVDEVYADLSINSNEITFSPSSPEPGEKLRITVKVRNKGSLLASNVSVKLLLSKDGNPETLAGTARIPKISSKGVASAVFELSVPSGAQELSFSAIANDDREILEQNYSNNKAVKNIIISLPDVKLSGEDISVVGNVSVGSIVTLKAVVTNLGDSTAENNVVSFYHRPPSGPDVLIGAASPASISPGSKKTYTHAWAVPQGITANPVIIAIANPQKTFYESDFGNNMGSLALNAKLPDLTVSLSAWPQTVVIPSAPSYKKYLTLTASVHNTGTAKASNILVRIYNQTGVAAEQLIPSLDPGKNSSINYYFPVTSALSQGTYSFAASVDPEDSITEISNSNNNASLSASLVPNRPPTAVISADKTNPLKNELVSFDCYGSFDAEPETRNSFFCEWNFGDGSENETGMSVWHAYSSPGTYTVTLRVTDAHGASDTDILPISVQPNRPPTAVLNGPFTAYKGEEEFFDPSASSDPDGGIVSVHWNFGDGSTSTTGFEPGVHTYSSTGTYVLSMTVYDSEGASSTDSTTVYVVNPPPMTTKTHAQVYHGHTYVSPIPGDPRATVVYALYKVDYEIKYTSDTLKSVKYTLTSGPAIVSSVTDASEESLFIPITVTSTQGGTALQVESVEVHDGSGNIWRHSGGPHLSASESPVTVAYTGIDEPFNPSGAYIVIYSTVEYPAQMCAAEQYDCQRQSALWRFG